MDPNTTPTPQDTTDSPAIAYGMNHKNPKKFLLMLFIVLLLLGGLGGGIFLAQRQQDVRSRAAITGPTLAMTPSTVSKGINETFSIALTLNTNTASVSGSSIEVSYNTQQLQAQSVTKGTFLPVEFVPGTINNGKITMTVGSQPQQAAKGAGIVATITFKSLAAGTSTISYTQATQVAAIGQNTNALSGTTGSQITITAGSGPTATQGACPTPAMPSATSAPGATSCTSTMQSMKFSWGAVSGATKYYLRIDDTSNGWVNCGIGNPNTGDFCIDNITATNYTKALPAGKQYKWWVSAFNSCGGQSLLTTQQTFSTPATCTTGTPSPTPMRTPTSTLGPGTPSPTLAPNVADINRNGIVNIVDYTLYMQAWFGTTGTDLTKADLNKDGRKSAIDYTIFMNGWHEYKMARP